MIRILLSYIEAMLGRSAVGLPMGHRLPPGMEHRESHRLIIEWLYLCQMTQGVQHDPDQMGVVW